MRDAKGGKHPGNVSCIPKPNEVRKLPVERPELQPESLLGKFSPQLALDRHQSGSIRLFLQLLPSLRVLVTVQTILPGRGEVQGMAWLLGDVERLECKVGRQLSS